MLLRHRFGDAIISHPQPIRQVGFSRDGSLLATCGAEDQVCIWDWTRQVRLHQVQGSAFAFGPDADVLYFTPLQQRRAKHRNVEVQYQTANVVKFDVRSGKTLAQSRNGRIQIKALAVSPDGRMVATSRFTRPAVFHDAQTLKPLFELKPPGKGTVGSIVFLDEERVLTKGYTSNDYDEVAYVWDLMSKKPVLTFSGIGSGVSISPDRRHAAGEASEDGLTRVWDLQDGKVVQEFRYDETESVSDTSFLENGQLLAAVGEGQEGYFSNGRVKIWNIQMGDLVEDLQPSGCPRKLACVCVSPDGRWLVVGAGDGRLRVWDRTIRTELQQHDGHTNYVSSVVMIDEATLLSSGFQDHTIRRWDIKAGRPLGIERTFPEIAGKLCFSPASGILASAHDTLVRLWKPRERSIAPSQTLIGELAVPSVKTIYFSRDGRRLVTAGSDGFLRLWDAIELRETSRIRVHAEKSDRFVSGLALCPDESGVAITQMWSSDVSIWDWQTGSQIASLESERRDLCPLAFSYDGEWCAAGGADSGEITVWSWPEKKIVHRLVGTGGGHIGKLAFSPTNGNLLASADAGGGVEMFDLDNGTRIGGDNIRSGQALSICFSADGRQLIAGSAYGVIAVWDIG